MTSRTSLDLLAPAKLNLFLHITGRRDDGYHDLQTLFQLLDHGDTMQFAAQRGGVVSLHVAATAEGRRLPLRDNLILHAASELARVADCQAGAAIRLEKRLPIGGGLGGGSANAAAALLGLNELWRLELPRQELARIGAVIGADVPLFVYGQSAWGEGRGDVLQAVELPAAWYLVVTPPCQVATAEIFHDPALQRNSPRVELADLLAGDCRNDCEAVTRRLYPAVDEAFRWLERHGEPRMSGTGASVFIEVADESAGEQIIASLPRGWQAFVAPSLAQMAHVEQD